MHSTGGRHYPTDSNPAHHYEQLPILTIWIEFPDIAVLQSKGITHSPYILPSIEDPNIGVLIVDSLAIAAHLDEMYPETLVC